MATNITVTIVVSDNSYPKSWHSPQSMTTTLWMHHHHSHFCFLFQKICFIPFINCVEGGGIMDNSLGPQRDDITKESKKTNTKKEKHIYDSWIKRNLLSFNLYCMENMIASMFWNIYICLCVCLRIYVLVYVCMMFVRVCTCEILLSLLNDRRTLTT